MAYFSLTCGRMEIKFNIPLQQYTTLLLISMYMLQVWLVEFLQRELALHSTVWLLTNTSADMNTTVMWWCILPKKTCIHESGFHSVILPKRFLKIRLSFPTHTHCVSLSPHIIVQAYDGKFWQFYQIQLYFHYSLRQRPPLWSSGQSSWLQIRRSGFDSRHYQKKKVVGLERGPLNLMSTTEELLDRKVAAPV
jgi:hypothetical protein